MSWYRCGSEMRKTNSSPCKKARQKLSLLYLDLVRQIRSAAIQTINSSKYEKESAQDEEEAGCCSLEANSPEEKEGHSAIQALWRPSGFGVS